MATRSNSRDVRIVASVPCPVCKAQVGERCRNPYAHQQGRGPEDRRPQPAGPHTERRMAWIEWKQQKGIV
jgi:hypothetical protein